MASCDDDFSLLGDDNAPPPQPSSPPTNPNLLHHHHHHLAAFSHRFSPKPTPFDTPPSHRHPPPSRSGITPPSAGGSSDQLPTVGGDGDDGESFSDGAFGSQDVNHFNENESDPIKSAANLGRDKRKEGDEFSDGGTATPYSNKKQKMSATGGGEYRKDREEWSDTAIGCLLDVYLEKFMQLNRGNLRGRDWEEVAVYVSERCDKQTKSVEQCKNKVDNLKKRYKLERHRMNNGGTSASHWPWFSKMELIVGNSLQSKAVSEDEKPVTSSTKQTKRYGVSTASPGGQVTTAKPKPSSNQPPPRWRRVVFKISGATLAGTGGHNIDPKIAMLIAREVSTACRLGVEVAIVVGGRNFFCGDTWVTSTGLDRCTAYQIGMMATVMNSILLQSALEKIGIQTRVQTAFTMPEVAEPYSRQKAIRHLEKGRVVIFGGIGAGTGNPIFSTDTVSALRASEIHADAVLKGTNVEGVYLCDPRSTHVVSEHISFRELISRGASPMDMMAATFCEENGIPVVIFNLHEPGNISRALCGERVGTLIDQTGRVG